MLELLEQLGLSDPWVPLLVLLQLQRLHQGLRHDTLQVKVRSKAESKNEKSTWTSVVKRMTRMVQS